MPELGHVVRVVPKLVAHRRVPGIRAVAPRGRQRLVRIPEGSFVADIIWAVRHYRGRVDPVVWVVGVRRVHVFDAALSRRWLDFKGFACVVARAERGARLHQPVRVVGDGAAKAAPGVETVVDEAPALVPTASV